ncbi:MAG: hypothetical protein MK212_11075 [Saprospiraceae bacterium]|nr:hypothetical protein [Saprospiraceae bacterium]
MRVSVHLFLGIIISLIFGACNKQDTSSRDKFLGTYSGQHICDNYFVSTMDTAALTAVIEEVPWSVDSIRITFTGDNIDSISRTQYAGYVIDIIDFKNGNFAAEKNGDTLILNELSKGYPCEAILIKQD